MIPYPAPMPHQRKMPSRVRSVATPPSRGRLYLARVLLLLLVLVGHLGYGLSALADDHGADGCGPAVLAMPAAGGDAHAEAGCDHGCHAAAHLLAIFPGGGLAGAPAVSSQFNAPAPLPWLSRVASPPVRPPKPLA